MTNMFFQILSTNIYTTLFSIVFKSLNVNMTCVWKEDCRLTFINEAEKANIHIQQQTIEAEPNEESTQNTKNECFYYFRLQK